MQPLSFFHPTEHAISNFRRGQLAILDATDEQWLIGALETIHPDLMAYVSTLCGLPTLIVPGSRMSFLFPNHPFPKTSALPLNALPDTLLLDTLLSTSKPLNTSAPTSTEANSNQALSLLICHLAELLPIAIAWKIKNNPFPETIMLPTLTPSDITNFSDTVSRSLVKVCEAPLTLEQSQNVATSIIAYRSPIGGHEHYAIVVGDAVHTQSAPLVRIHSSCYTGDLLSSLKCDCRDQLHSAIAHMAQHEGGIIIYLMQEGRGIGLANKLRTYALQHQGLDTVDANRALGFDDDERLFMPAATILNLLQIPAIKLLTNNPRKASGIEAYGIKVKECVPHIMTPHEHNHEYLSTKKDRLGHHFDKYTPRQ